MQIYWNKTKRLQKKRVQLLEDWSGTPTWPPFHCFGTPIWPPWRHVKTLNKIKRLMDHINYYGSLIQSINRSVNESINKNQSFNQFISFSLNQSYRCNKSIKLNKIKFLPRLSWKTHNYRSEDFELCLMFRSLHK